MMSPGMQARPVQELESLLDRFVVGQIAETAVGERREARVVRHLLVGRVGWGRVSPVEHHPDEILVLLLGRLVADIRAAQVVQRRHQLRTGRQGRRDADHRSARDRDTNGADGDRGDRGLDTQGTPPPPL